MMFRVILGLLCCSVAWAALSYDGFKIYDVTAINEYQKELLKRLEENETYDFFSLPKAMGHAARVLVSPETQSDFEGLMKNHGIEFEVINENVAESIAMEQVQSLMLRSSDSGISFSKFNDFSEINAYLDSLALAYPSRVSVKTISKSFEGRDMKTITITNGDGRANKNVILLDAGIHAREWIAPAGALYVIHQLVENFKENADLLQTFDWVVLPVVNPDGYAYTHSHSRFWRKTRKPVNSACSGTDGNRNFDFHWGETGASSLACSDTFKGTKAFSEPETQALRDLMTSFKGRAKMYLTLHSYGNYLLYPWGYTSQLPDTWRDIDAVAQAGAAAIKAHSGTKYTVGSSTNVLYAAAGGSDDYALAVAKIPIAVTMELPAGGTGFDPKPSQIQGFVAETWVGIRAMAKAVIAKY